MNRELILKNSLASTLGIGTGSSSLAISETVKSVLQDCGEHEIRFAAYWLYTGDRDEAARRLKLKVEDTYRDPFNLNAVRLYNALKAEPAIAAKAIIQHNAVRAALVQVRLLESPSEIIRLKASTEILKRAVPEELPTQKTEHVVYKLNLDLDMLQPTYKPDLEQYSVDGDFVDGEFEESDPVDTDNT